MSPAPFSARQLVLPGFGNVIPMDLHLPAGRRWLITGPDGSGKTTLIRTLLGLISPLAGQLFLFGHDLDTLPERQLLPLRRRVCLLQAVAGDGLFPAWSAFDNLALALRQHQPEKFRSDHALAETLVAEARRYGIAESWLEEPVANRSRQQRTALALWRGLRASPELVVVDGLRLDQSLVGDSFDVDRLLADALSAHPAIVVMASKQPQSLPARLPADSFEHGRMVDGRLEWAAMEPAAPIPHA